MMELTNWGSTKAGDCPQTPHWLGTGGCVDAKAGLDDGERFPAAKVASGSSVTDLLFRTGAVVAGLLIMASAMVQAADDQSRPHGHADWQVGRLMAPTPTQLAAESRGQVFIYDSLHVHQVDAAMDANFDRIEHMMFTRIYHPAPTPDTPAYLLDDGCD